MDSLTQACLGAVVGYTIAGQKMGKKALLWGAIAGTLPDLDFIPTTPLKDPFLYLKYHRGFSHSLLFTFFGSIGFGLVMSKIASKWKKGLWINLFFWGILTHIILDCFTSWGTQVFWPLSKRVSWHAVFIIDPAYTLPLFISILVAIFAKKHQLRIRYIIMGLIMSTLYLVLCLGVKHKINIEFKKIFHNKGLSIKRIISRPSPFNIILWSATAETDEGYYYTMVSLLDKQKPPVYFIPKYQKIPVDIITPKVQALLYYTQGFYNVEPSANGILIHDLRYGFLGDPFKQGEQYVFSYHVTQLNSGKQKLTIHNPRPKDKYELLKQLWERLKGI